MDNDDGFDYLFKIVLVGDMGVGKTLVIFSVPINFLFSGV